MRLEKKHRLAKSSTALRGLFVEASIWSLDDEDRDMISGVGLLEVIATNLKSYPCNMTVEAKGKNIRWETQPNTNKKLTRIIDDSSAETFFQTFDVESPVLSNQRINVMFSADFPLSPESINRNISLVFKNSAESRLLYRKEDFERTCSIIVPDFEIVNQELIDYFSKNTDQLYKLHWRKFEELLDAIFKNLGYHTELGPGRGDEGVDLRIFHKDEVGEILTLVQAKKYDPKHPIGLEPVQALSAIVDIENAQRGLFVTTSRYLPSAKQFAAKKEKRLILAESSDVGKWCEKITKNSA